ncbi:MAG TPA: tetratricopeptide repeat protein [Acidobacteriaceae bacterium]|nr:tetratricopeptide repeat protein [Acidobacteriaceae bacterium]
MRIAVLILVMAAAAPILSGQTAAPDAARQSLEQAQRQLEEGNAAEAIASLEQMASVQPPVHGVQHALGVAYYRTGKLAQAQSAFAKAIQEDPADLESVQMEGLVLYRLNQPAAAIPFLERVRQWTPNANTDANYVLGLCYLNARRYDDARGAFASEFGVPPGSASAHLLLGTMLMRLNLPEMAAQEASKALQLSPDLPLAHFMLGEVFLYRADVARATEEFEQERRINPTYAGTYDRLGDVYERSGRLQEAQEALTKALSLDTSSTGPFIQMGKVLIRRQDPQTATMYLKHAEAMDPGNALTHTLLAQAYHKLGRELEAKQEADLASSIRARQQPTLEPLK